MKIFALKALKLYLNLSLLVLNHTCIKAYSIQIYTLHP